MESCFLFVFVLVPDFILARYPFHRRRIITPNLCVEGRLRKVPYYLLTKLDIRLTETTFLSENTLMILARMLHEGSGIYSVAAKTVWSIVQTSIAIAMVFEGSDEM